MALKLDEPTEVAIACTTEAVNLYGELVAAYPEAFTKRLAAAAHTLADLHEAIGDVGEAERVRTRYGI